LIQRKEMAGVFWRGEWQRSSMQHAVIFCHPRTRSFTGSVADAYRKAAEELGHTVIMRDLYRMKFDPCLKAEEIPGPNLRAGADVVTERDLLKDANVFALIYPLWLNAPPAMIKGYMERVFGYGFAYGAGGRSAQPLLKGRKLISFSSSGAPLDWVKRTGAFGAVHLLYDSYLSDLFGATALDHVHFGNVVPGATADFVTARLAEVRAAVHGHFKAMD
jgi:NAD(P)H dehydrogenase (quinone)